MILNGRDGSSWPALGICLSLAGCSAARAEIGPVPTPESGTLAPIPVLVSSSQAGMPHAIVRRQNYRIDFAPYAIEVDPTDGGRIVAFSFNGKSVVVPREESPDAYGSSFWPSPQSDWNWPPPVEIDKGTWQTRVEGPVLILQSAVDSKLSLSVEQRIQADPERGCVRIDYTLENHGAAPRKVAPWQNTRVRPGGLTFYPSAEGTLPDSPLKLDPRDGITWFRHDPAAMKENLKSFADGREGWLAHVDGDLVFVKVFPEVPRAEQAPKEAEIELYVDGSGRFLEMEQQGAYVELAPGAASHWHLVWLVRRLPKSVPAEPGTALADHVRALVVGVR